MVHCRYKSYIPFLRCFVIKSQKLKDVSLSLACRDRFIPKIIVWVFPPRNGTVVVELDAYFGRVQPHRSVEHVAPSEIQQRIGVLVDMVVLDVDSVVSGSFVLADPHVGKARFVAGG